MHTSSSPSPLTTRHEEKQRENMLLVPIHSLGKFDYYHHVYLSQTTVVPLCKLSVFAVPWRKGREPVVHFSPDISIWSCSKGRIFLLQEKKKVGGSGRKKTPKSHLTSTFSYFAFPLTSPTTTLCAFSHFWKESDRGQRKNPKSLVRSFKPYRGWDVESGRPL